MSQPVSPALVRRAARSLAYTALASAVLAVSAPVFTASAADGGLYAQDGFDKSHSSGWGKAPTGGAWSVVGGSSQSVAGSSAVVKRVLGGRSLRASLAGVTKSDVQVTASYVVPKNKDVYLGVEARRQSGGSAYRGRARIDAKGMMHSEVVRIDGSTEKILMMSSTTRKVSPGQIVVVDLEVSGDEAVTVRSRSYVAGQAVPDWTVSAVDTGAMRLAGDGSVGVQAYNDKGNASTDVSITSFSAGPVSKPAVVEPAPSATGGVSTPSTSPSASASAAASPTSTPSASPTASASPTGSPTVAPTASPTASASPSGSPTVAPTASPTASASPTAAPSPTGSPSASPAPPAGSSTGTDVYAQDGFDGTYASGWGAAPVGGAWSVVGGSGSATANGSAVVKSILSGRSLRATLPGVTKGDVQVSASFVVPTNKNMYLSVEGRRQSDGSAYRGRARIDAKGEMHSEVVRVNGSTETILKMDTTTVSVTPGQVVTVELQLLGTDTVNVRSRSFVTGTTVPDWAVNATDASASRISAPGLVGVHAYNNAGNDTTDVSLTTFSAGAVPSPVTSSSPAPAAVDTVDPSTPATTAAAYGSADVGTTTYAVPAGAIFVSASGSDTGDGTQARPFATVTKAITKVPGGGTVVLRGGTYHEYFIVPPGKNITVQSYPGEAVWFDGSSPVSGFHSAGDDWVVDGWTTEFDASPTYTKGAPDGTTVGWQFVNPEHPMAAHPDAVWIDGTEQTQVGSATEVKPGTFFVDYSSDQLYLGTDPTGRKVEASTLSQAVSLRAPGTTLRGLGFRRYADSVWQQGVITAYYPGMTLENLVVADSATAGIGIFKPDSVVRDVTITGSGQLGMQAGLADNLVVDDVKIVNSNDEHFNPAPSAGGFKVTMTRGFTMKNSEIVGTDGNGFWTDQSTYDINLLNNFIHAGKRWGIVLEISSKALVSDNVISDNDFDGLMVADTDHVDIWNNTIVRNGRSAVALTQDTRRIEQLSVSGHDPRRPQPDTSMPWTTLGTTLANNILAGGSGADPIVKVQAYDKAFAASDMLVLSEGNVYSQTAVGAPRYVTVWGRKNDNPVSYPTMYSYTSATGRDTTSLSSIAPSPVDAAYRAYSSITSKAATTAQPLPAAVATKVGQAVGAKQLGAF